jgi:hypothetical protein
VKRQTAMTTNKISHTIMQTHKASIIGYNKENHQTKWYDEMVVGGGVRRINTGQFQGRGTS